MRCDPFFRKALKGDIVLMPAYPASNHANPTTQQGYNRSNNGLSYITKN